MSHRRPPNPPRVPGARATVLAAVAGMAAAFTPASAGADPAEESAADPTATRARLSRLHEAAERATERYNAAAERTEDLRAEVERIRDRVARGQDRVNRLRDELGPLAGAQYRSGGVDPAVLLLLSEDPRSYLERAAALDRIGDRKHNRLLRLRGALRSLRQQRAEGAAGLAELREREQSLRRHKQTVLRKLAAARRLLDRLPAEEHPGRAERSDRSGRPPATGARPAGRRPAASRAAAATAAAARAVGSPYAWGHAGPAAFDCSGLTQWAWAQAGVSIPRTSQGQARIGARVPLEQARPGDLVLYRSDASHVAMYMGGGRVVHAPYPGARVRYDPVDMMPVSAVTRP